MDIKDLVKSLKPSERKEKILSLCGNVSIEDPTWVDFLNQLVLIESEPILKKTGQKYHVTKGKIDRRKQKIGICYGNSALKMREGYGYVEGYVVNEKTGYKMSHAWNVDSNGIHVDFTLDDPENYDYFGVIIPDKIVYRVGRENGRIWYSVLPFTKDI
jgi:hypothetical protein